MSKTYTDQEQIEAFLQRDLTEAEQSNVESVIAGVSDFIKTYTNRNWNDLDAADPDEEERVYDGSGGGELFLDDFTEITSIEFLDWTGALYDTIPESDYIPYPLNTDPKNSIQLRARRFPRGRANIRITGTFTSGDVPQTVQLVASQLAGNYFEQAKTVGGYKREQIEGYLYELMSGKEHDERTQHALNLLDPLRKFEF